MRNFTLLVILFLFSITSYAQPCSGLGGNQTGDAIIFCNNTDPVNVFDMLAGDYALVYVCSGNTYTFTTCNSLYVGDTEISVLDEFGNVITGAATDYVNDNTCGLSGNDETLVWSPPAAYASGGYVQVVVTQNDLILGACQNVGSPADIQISADGTCAPAGACCEFPEFVSSATYSSGNINTCGFGSFYDDIIFNSCAEDNFYMNGNEYVIEYTPPSTGAYEFSMPSNDNTFGYFVLDGCPDAGPSCLVNNGAFTGPPPVGNAELIGGNTYYIVIGTNPAAVPDGIQCGDFEFEINPSPQGAICFDPIVISDGPFPQNINGQTTCGFGNEYLTSNCAQDLFLEGEEIVYTFTPSTGGCYSVGLTAEAYSSITILDDCPDAGGACIGFAGDANPDPSLTVTLDANTTYYLVISSDPLPDCVAFDMTIDMCPPGNVCEDPFIIPSAPYSQTGTTCGFIDDYDAIPCGDDSYIGGEDYVMEFTPTTTGCYNLLFENTDTYLGVFVVDNCPAGAADCIAFDGNSSTTTTTDAYLESGTTYYFIVSTFPTPECSNFDFTLSECAQDGEDCATPAILNTGSLTSNTTCAMGDNYDQNDGCMNTFMNGDETVFEFTPGSDGCYDFVVSNAVDASGDFGLFILDDCPDATTNCVAQATESGAEPSVTANLLGGMTYTVVLATSICTDFDIVVNSVACPLGADCANPEVLSTGSNGSYDMATSGDDYETTDACGGDYMGGNDFVMTFTPTITDCYNFTTSAAAGFNPEADLGLFILDGCPDVVGTNCITFSEVMDGFPMADAFMNAGQTYYIVVGAVEFTTPFLLGPSTTIFDMTVTGGGTDCPSGVNCGNPIAISGTGGSFTDLTNCGFGNDYDDTDGCMNVYMAGEETVFTFTPSVTDCYDIITSAAATSDPANDDIGLFVLDDCPDIPSVTCLLEETMENGFPSGSVYMNAGETYYIVVSAVDDAGALIFSDCADFDFEIMGGSTSCPVDCNNAIPVGVGSNPGMTSCGAGDDYQDTDIAGCGNTLDFYLNSEETVMTFTPPSTGCYIFETSNGSNPTADPAIFVFDGCPDTGPNCIATGVDEDDMPATTAQLTGGVEYYIVFSAIEIIGTPGGSVYSATCTDFDLDISSCPPQAPTQDCNGAIAVCQDTYSYSDGFLGSGADPNEIPSGNCLVNGELNSVWFAINVQSDGLLSFLISPDDLTDDYDFAVFDITDNGCSGISSGASPELSCNYSISAGATGAQGPDVGIHSQGADGALLNSSMTVTTGQTLVLIVSNFSTSLSGFTLDFGASTADIVDDSTPDFDMVVEPVACDATTFDVSFDEPIICTTIATCDFSLTFPDASVHSLTDVIAGSECGTGGNFESDFTFTVDAPMSQNGTYTLNLGSGCGGVEDNCGNTQDNTSITFSITDCATCSIDMVTPTDANCGMSDGSAEVSVSGTGPFTVVIAGETSTGTSPVTVSDLPSGVHTVTLTDDLGCMSTSSVTIGDIPGPSVDMVTPSNSTCGNADGSVEIVISGGSPDYTLTVTGQPPVSGPSPITVSGLSSGSYDIDVTDTNGCTTTSTVSISDDAGPTIVSITPTEASCGGMDGTAEVVISGGAAPYTVTIGGAAPVTSGSPVTVTGLAPGMYPVDVVDDNGCSTSSMVMITEQTSPMIDLVTPSNSTCGNADGSVELVITGGSPDYTVTVTGQPPVSGPSPLTVSGLSSGSYDIDVIDSNGCTTTSMVSIIDDAGPTIDNITATEASCGGMDGSAEVTISGGAAPYTVTIGGAAPVTSGSPVTVTGLSAGMYPVNVVDDNGCSTSSTVTIIEQAGPMVDMVTPMNATCGNADGSVEVVISGGTANYTVTIDGQTVTGPSPLTVSGLSTDTYDIDVTDSNGCTTTSTVTIDEDSAPTIDQITPTESSCGGASDGTVEVAISGGSPDYTLTVDGQTVTGTSPLTIIGLAPGLYTVSIVDDNGCMVSSTVDIVEQESPTIGTVTPSNSTCGNADGTAEVVISGGQSDYTVEINSITMTGPSPVTISGLAAGTYTINVTDDNGCTDTGTVTISDDSGPVIDMITAVDADCGMTNGSAEVVISGGTPDYTVTISGQPPVTGVSPLSIPDLAPGTYTVDVLDDNGCSTSGSVTIGEQESPTISMITPTNSNCGAADGSAEVTIIGGMTDYTVTIDGNTVTGPSPLTVMGLSEGTYTVSVSDANSCTDESTVTITDNPAHTIDDLDITGATCGLSDGSVTITLVGGMSPFDYDLDGTVQTNNPTFTGLAEGTYPLIVTDDNGCTATADVVIGGSPSIMISSVDATDETCGQMDGTATVNITGGTTPITYNVNGVDQIDNNVFTGLSMGTYDVEVTDANGCSDMSTVTIGETLGPIVDDVSEVDASCGQSDGEVTITISGGISDYDVEVNSVTQTTSGMTTFTSLASGIYVATVTDANGCTTTANVNITDADGPMIEDISVTDANCGMSTGEVVVTASGGTGSLTISLDGTSNGTNTFSGLSAGTYDIEVEDENGCIATGTAIVGDNAGPTIDNVVTTASSCTTDDGTATVTISGGVADYTVVIGTQMTTGAGPDIVVNDLGAGTYTATVTDDNGCTATMSVEIDEAASPTINSIDVTNENCDQANGSLSVNVTGGMPSYTYDIGNGTPQVGDNTFTGLTNGTYTVTVTDDNGCTDTGDATINNIAGVAIDMLDITDAGCGEDDGAVTITLMGGQSPFNYDLDGTMQLSNPTFTDLAAGTYPLIVTDANGCTATSDVLIDGSAGITIDDIAATNETCGQMDGSATINITGGTTPISYTLDGVDQIDNNIYTGLSSGTYDVLVTDANGCTDMSSVTIDETSGPMIDDITEVNASCGQSDGEATILASGGVGPYDYTLDGVTQTDPNNTFTGLSSGNYIVTVTDQNGCTTTSTANITDADGPVIDDVQTTDANCDMSTGTATILASGGVAPLTIRLDGVSNGTNTFTDLSPGSHDVEVEDANGCISTTTAVIGNLPGVVIDDIMTTQSTCGNADGTKTVTFSGGTGGYNVTCNGTTQTTTDNTVTFTGLTSGVYTVIVTDANGCTDEGTGTVDEAAAPVINNIAVVDASCGNADGSITINASGGLAPYTYNNGGADQSSNIFDNLSSGTYNPVVTDANGCTATLSATVNDILGVVIDDISTTPATCGNADGTKTIMVSGGAPPYTYDCDGTIQVGNNLFENLAAGTYPVVVTDGNGCTATATATISDADGPMIDDIQITDASCGMDNGSVIIIANGGTSPYTYSINGGAGQMSNSFTGLSSGPITVLVVDANGCNVSQNTTIGDTPIVTIDDLEISDANCDMTDGSVTITIGGGTAPFTYDLDGTVQVSNSTYTGLGAGSYPLTVTDANGCEAMSTVMIDNLPGAMIDDLTIVDASCSAANGSITVVASGGETPYTYQLDGNGGQANNLFANLIAGTYDILVTDNNGCTSQMTATIDGTGSPVIDDIVTTNATCGSADGSATVLVSGGTTPYSYTANGMTLNDPVNIFTGLASGNYPLTVIDANGCVVTGTINITDANGPVIDGVETTAATCGTATGTVTINASGGAAPLTIFLNGNENGTNVFTDLMPGVYNVSVIDANGCNATATATVDDTPGVVIDNITSTPSSCGQDNGTVTINVSGGTDPITYDLDGMTQIGSNVFAGVTAGTYPVTVTDANGCADTDMVTVDNADGPVLDNFAVVDASCGNADGSVTLNVSGGTSPYIYALGANTQVDNEFTGLAPSDYDFTITDANGCEIMTTITVGDIPGVIISNISTIDASCGNADGSLTVMITGGSSPYSYDLGSGPQASNVFNNLASGFYIVTVTDDNGCTDSSSATLNDANGPIVDSESSTPASCGNSDGTVTLEITGGTTPYTVTLNGSTMNTNNNTTFTGLVSGDYPYTITDANGCEASGVVTVDGADTPIIDEVTVTGATPGNADGEVSVTVSGGVGPYDFDMDGTVLSGDPSVNFTGISGGTYSLTVTDANGCTVTQEVVVPEGDCHTIDDISSTTAECGQANGTITVTASGGIAPYMYILDGGTAQSSNVFTNLGASTYTITVIDASGCNVSDMETVIGTENPLIDDISVQDATCNNTDGSLTITVSGGASPYMYDIGSGQQTSNVIDNLGSGSYTVTVTDGNGCETMETASISDLDGPVLDDISTTPTTCGVDDGSVIITISGGQSPYDVMVNGVTQTTNNNTQFTDLSAGDYPVTVTDANGCVATGIATVNGTTNPLIDDISIVGATSGNADGEVSVTVSGGVGSYDFDLDGTVLSGDPMVTFTGLLGGTYTLVVTDSNGCSATAEVVVPEGDCPTIDDISITSADCGTDNGTITVTSSGGVAPLMYALDGGTAQVSNIFTGVSAGAHTVTVLDASGCVVDGSAAVGQNGGPSISEVSTENSSCGQNNGSATITAIDGLAPYMYSINGFVFQSDPTFMDMSSGMYTATIQDANGCEATQTFEIIDNAGPVVDNVTAISSACGQSNGIITITASGGTGLLSYSIDGGTTFQPAGVFAGLGAGGYNYVVMDDNCSVSGVISISNDGAPNVSVTASNASCGTADGTATIEITGGSAPFNYTIDGMTQDTPDFTGLEAGDYIAEVEDGNGCIGTSNFTITEVGDLDISISGDLVICADGFTELTAFPLDQGYDYSWSLGGATSNSIIVTSADAGMITLTATSGSCTGTAMVAVTVAPTPTANAGVDGQVDCSNPTTMLDGSTSTGDNLLYSWTTIGGNILGSTTVPVIEVNAAGQYILVVTDSETGCESEQDMVLVEQVGDPISNAGTPLTLNCDALSIMLDGSLSSQGANYSYAWSTDNGSVIDDETSLSPTVYATGTYTLMVTDDNSGCVAISTVVVGEDVSLPTDYTLNIMDENCFGDANGSIEVTGIVGGQGPFTYSLDGGLTFDTENEFDNLAPGSYDLAISSGTGCIISESIEILPGAQLSVDLGEDITIKLSEVATFVPVASIDTNDVVSYEWNVVGDASVLCEDCFAQTVSPDDITTFTLEIEDANGCIASDELTVFITKVTDIFMPNIFSPNADGNNDRLFPSADTDVITRVSSMRVYDRWGNLLFENNDFLPNDPSEGWDGTYKGKPLNPNVYMYMVEAELPGGDIRIFSGDITIVK